MYVIPHLYVHDHNVDIYFQLTLLVMILLLVSHNGQINQPPKTALYGPIQISSGASFLINFTPV
jgi:hypothetical protein